MARCTACRSVLVSSIHTTSVRGTITSRTMVSPSSNTDLQHLALGLLDHAAVARPCRPVSRSSMSEENGPSRKPRPGVIALPIRISSEATGDRTLADALGWAAAAARPTPYGCCRPRVRGSTPITT